MVNKARVFKPHIGDLIQKLKEYEENNSTDDKPYLVMSYITYLAFEDVHIKAEDYSVVQLKRELEYDTIFVAKYGGYKILIDNDLHFGVIEIR